MVRNSESAEGRDILGSLQPHQAGGLQSSEAHEQPDGGERILSVVVWLPRCNSPLAWGGAAVHRRCNSLQRPN